MDSRCEKAPEDGGAWNRRCADETFVLRGGAFSVDPEKLRPSYRYASKDQRMPFFGIRVARETE